MLRLCCKTSDRLEQWLKWCLQWKQGQRWPSGRVSALGPEGSRFKTQFPPKFGVYGACCKLNHTQWTNALPLVWRGSLEREVPAQVSSSSSDCGSK
ncbi:hypothetical protein AVEN_245698-1 [Araneus ventricosus]|uniref:Uncharacterized protein n=1 Tax=Araneus ventricosus TaxID=182803 RepID=A0A4Y2FNX0_ARAVE|nr:hypothetical protein AVEN_245698-1 [Araneus ventricosus]